MKNLIILVSIIFMCACSVQVIDMTPAPTVQQFDLTDSESDGVISARDKCPDSAPGSLVNNDGCGSEYLETVRVKLLINFDTDSYVVKPEYFSEIEKLSLFMDEYPSVKVTIEGHTSIRGKRSYNQILSQHRAEAIKDILVNDLAIDADRIMAVGYGFERLLLEGDDEYIHARNRRIVAEITSERAIKDMKWTIYSVDQPGE